LFRARDIVSLLLSSARVPQVGLHTRLTAELSRAAAAFDVKINATRRQLERIVGLTMKLDLAWLYYAAKILYLASPLLHLSILSAKGVV